VQAEQRRVLIAVRRVQNPKEVRQNKKGFISSDNAKRDEFSNTMRTSQWRENLTKEIRFTQKGAAGFYKNLPEPAKEDARMKMLLRRNMSSSAVIGAPFCLPAAAPLALARLYSHP